MWTKVVEKAKRQKSRMPVFFPCLLLSLFPSLSTVVSFGSPSVWGSMGQGLVLSLCVKCHCNNNNNPEKQSKCFTAISFYFQAGCDSCSAMKNLIRRALWQHGTHSLLCDCEWHDFRTDAGILVFNRFHTAYRKISQCLASCCANLC